MFTKKIDWLLYGFVAVLSLIPLLILFIVWGGLAPPGGIEYWNHGYTVSYKLSYLTAYISLIPVYTFPFYKGAVKNAVHNYKHLIVFLGFGLFYFLFPVAPSQVTLEQTGLTTIGLFHKLIRIITPGYVIEQSAFYILFAAGLIFLWSVLNNIFLQIKNRYTDFTAFLDLTIIFYLILLPFSYQVWEKYLLIVIPVLLLRLLLGFEPYRSNGLLKPGKTAS